MKKIGKIVTAFILVLSLTGCVKMDMSFKVLDAENIGIKMSMYCDEELMQDKVIEFYKEINNSTEISSYEEQELLNSLNIDNLINEMEESVKNDVNSEDAEFTRDTKKIGDQEWKGFTMARTITGDDAKEFLQEKDGILTLTLPLVGMGSNYVSTLEQYSTKELDETVKEMKDLGLEMQFTIEMPNKPTTTDGEVNGKTVTIDLLDYAINGDAQDIVITSKAKSNTGLYIGIGAVVVIAVVAIVLFTKNKNKKVPTNPTEGENTAVQPETPKTDEPVTQKDPQEEIQKDEQVDNPTDTQTDVQKDEQADKPKDIETKEQPNIDDTTDNQK